MKLAPMPAELFNPMTVHEYDMACEWAAQCVRVALEEAAAECDRRAEEYLPSVQYGKRDAVQA